MKILLIGYGSIGKRHEEVLDTFHNVNSIHIVTKQILVNKTTFLSMEDVLDLNCYDYYIIANETNKHYDYLKFLDAKLKDKKIFCEKPLFDRYQDLILSNNQVFIGYVLRFHPLLIKLKYLLSKEIVISLNIKCGQYLPTWRPLIDYKNSYSAKKNQGGGVLLDLSHEIDYMQWLCGTVDELKSYQVKISDLEINSDDFTTFIGKTINGIMINVSIDYISKITHRVIIIESLEHSYKLDFIDNSLIQIDKNGINTIFKVNGLERNDMFKWMHNSILADKQHNCTFNEAKDVMKTISRIQESKNV